MKKMLSLVVLAILSVALPLQASEQAKPAQLLRIIDKATQFTIATPQGAVEITRVMTACAKNKGWLQPLVPVEGVHPVGEIEILHALNDKDSVVVDMRQNDDRSEGTIPGSIGIPFNDIVARMAELGCNKTATAFECSKAKKVYAFCNGPVCPQSPMAIKQMVDNNFPPGKIYYYRGGMLDWEALGLTIRRDAP